MELIDAYLPLILVPALILALLAQLSAQAIYARSSQTPAKMSGYAVARHLLDGAGLYKVEIAQVPGQLSNHFDSRRGLLQLTSDVYHGRNLTALGIAAHEAGHAIQDSRRAGLSIVRNAAVAAASYGSGAGILLAVVGLILRFPPFLAFGVLLFSGAVYFQLVNLPVEIHASMHARRMLVSLKVIDADELTRVRWVLMAAAVTYVGATLQSILTMFQRVAAAVGGERRS